MKDLKLDSSPITKLLIHYSLPAILGMIVSALYNVVDRIFIGNIPEIGSLAITGVGITMPITTIITAVSMLIGVGATASISLNLGKKHQNKAEEILGNTIMLSVLGGILMVGAGILFMDDILNFFGASESTLSYAKAYIGIILMGTPINIAGYALNNITRADGSPRIAAFVMAFSCLLNIILDKYLVFGLGMGITGAAYATVIAQGVTLISGLGHFLKKSKSVRLKLNALKPSKEAIMQIVSIGISPFVTMLLASVVQILNNRFLKLHGGDYAIGAMATIVSVSIMCFMPIQGITQGAQPIIGYNYGAGKNERALEALKKSTIAGILLMVISLILIEVFPDFIISFFGGDETLKGVAKDGMRIYIMGLPAIAVGMNIILYFQAIGATKLALFFSILRQMVLLIPALMVFSNVFGLRGVWLAQPFSDYASMGIVLYFLKKEIERQNKEIPETVISNRAA